jgi:hypothetical protein
MGWHRKPTGLAGRLQARTPGSLRSKLTAYLPANNLRLLLLTTVCKFLVSSQAAYYGSGLPVLLMLKNKGANFLERTNEGQTPSQIAASRGKTNCVSNIGGIIEGTIGTDGTPLHYLCPVTQDFMNDPVALVTGHIFERAAIEGWFAARMPNVNNPLTGLALADLTLTPQPALQAEIHAFLAANPTMSD